MLSTNSYWLNLLLTLCRLQKEAKSAKKEVKLAEEQLAGFNIERFDVT